MKHQFYVSDPEIIAIMQKFEGTRGGFNRWLLQAAREKLSRTQILTRIDRNISLLLDIARGDGGILSSVTSQLQRSPESQEDDIMSELDWGV